MNIFELSIMQIFIYVVTKYFTKFITVHAKGKIQEKPNMSIHVTVIVKLALKQLIVFCELITHKLIF